MCCARALTLSSVKLHESVLARRSELTAHFLTWEYPQMLLLAEDWGQEQQGDGSDCSVPCPPKGRTALFAMDLTRTRTLCTL